MSLSKKFPKQTPAATGSDAEAQARLFEACDAGDTGTMEKILTAEPALLDTADEAGWTPLHHAASWAQTGAVELLLERGARTDIKDGAGYTAAQQAARQNFAPVVDMIADAAHYRARRMEREEKERQAQADRARAARLQEAEKIGKGLGRDIAVNKKPLKVAPRKP